MFTLGDAEAALPIVPAAARPLLWIVAQRTSACALSFAPAHVVALAGGTPASGAQECGLGGGSFADAAHFA